MHDYITKPRRAARTVLGLCVLLSLAGCVAEDNDSSVDLGSVSIGNQLIDLKKARDAGAISGSEYRKLKADLLILVESLTPPDDAQDAPAREQAAENDAQDDEDKDAGFLF